MKINLRVNKESVDIDIKPDDTLYDVLNRMGYKSVKKSCGIGCCGACTVLLDGEPIPSCSYLAVKARNHDVTTIEGVHDEAEKIGRIMVKEGAVQCGYCNPGFVLTVVAMKNELCCPCDDDIKNYLSGNLCRCSGYSGQLRAVKEYLGVSQC